MSVGAVKSQIDNFFVLYSSNLLKIVCHSEQQIVQWVWRYPLKNRQKIIKKCDVNMENISLNTYKSRAEIEGGSAINSNSLGGSLGIKGSATCFKISCWTWDIEALSWTGAGAGARSWSKKI